MLQFIHKNRSDCDLIVIKVSSSLTVLSEILTLNEIGDRSSKQPSSSSESVVFIYIKYSKKTMIPYVSKVGWLDASSSNI